MKREFVKGKGIQGLTAYTYKKILIVSKKLLHYSRKKMIVKKEKALNASYNGSDGSRMQ